MLSECKTYISVDAHIERIYSRIIENFRKPRVLSFLEENTQTKTDLFETDISEFIYKYIGFQYNLPINLLTSSLSLSRLGKSSNKNREYHRYYLWIIQLVSSLRIRRWLTLFFLLHRLIEIEYSAEHNFHNHSSREIIFRKFFNFIFSSSAKHQGRKQTDKQLLRNSN